MNRFSSFLCHGYSSLILFTGFVFICGCNQSSVPLEKSSLESTQQSQNVSNSIVTIREPAVAGLFYPQNSNVLFQAIQQLIDTSPKFNIGKLKALICPHAGYPYSGFTAATGYKMLAGKEYTTVIILAASHYASFSGASVSAADAYRTPFGLMPVSPKAKLLAKESPFIIEPRCPVQRPPWSSQSSRSEPPDGQDTPETWEHSIEVHVPFLQYALKKASLLPAICGSVNPISVAETLSKFIDDNTLIIASSDLSHYFPYDQAKQLDQKCVQSICSLDLEQTQKQEACGKIPILALMHLAKKHGWKTQLLDSRNSGDTSGDKSRVVGYASIAFYEAENTAAYAPTEKKELLQWARKCLKSVVTQGFLPPADPRNIPAAFSSTKGCFVTLTINGQLRGCIGHIVPKLPLYLAIRENAESAAIRDPRFKPVTSNELDSISIEISVLTEPKPLSFSSPEDLISKLKPHVDGVVLQVQGRGATYLPQVWEQIPDKEEFLNNLSQKAGCAASAWRQPGTSVLIYHVESFKESEF